MVGSQREDLQGRPPPPDIPGQWTCENCFQERVWPTKHKCFRCGYPKLPQVDSCKGAGSRTEWKIAEECYPSGEPHHSYPETVGLSSAIQGTPPPSRRTILLPSSLVGRIILRPKMRMRRQGSLGYSPSPDSGSASNGAHTRGIMRSTECSLFLRPEVMRLLVRRNWQTNAESKQSWKIKSNTIAQ